MTPSFRVGFGYDVHRLVEDRVLILGGVTIQSPKGLDGYSDADVLLHAICDALLGAAALGDIGRHFPNTDAQWKDASSLVLLARVRELIVEAGYVVGNVDAMLALERPKIQPYVMEMRENIARVLRIPVDAVSVKATTNERLGFVGAEEGAVAYAVCLIQKGSPE